jgi:hypothetical protein
MTNKEALQAQINFPLKDSSIELALLNASVNPDLEYIPEDSQKGVETALAGLILIIATSPKSVGELDYSVSAQDIEDLLSLRSIFVKRWNLPDELAYHGAIIQDASNLW